MTERTRRDAPDTVEKILSCDCCGKYLGDDIHVGMIFWNTGEDIDDRDVKGLLLAHKRCANRRPEWEHSDSAELHWFAEPRIALRKVSELSSYSCWTAPQLQRIVDVAWAVSHIASPKDAANLRKSEAEGFI